MTVKLHLTTGMDGTVNAAVEALCDGCWRTVGSFKQNPHYRHFDVWRNVDDYRAVPYGQTKEQADWLAKNRKKTRDDYRDPKKPNKSMPIYATTHVQLETWCDVVHYACNEMAHWTHTNWTHGRDASPPHGTAWQVLATLRDTIGKALP